MPRQVNRLPGIKQLSSGKWQARVFHDRGEESKNFTRQEDAKTWQRNLKSELERCPEGIDRQKRQWVVTILSPSGVITKAFAELENAIDWRAKSLSQLKSGTWLDPDIVDATLEDYVPLWKKNKVEVSGKTMATYNSQLRVHILPILGGYSLPALRNSHIRSWIVELVEGDIGQTTIKQSFRLLKQILEAAVTDGRMLSNPCNGIKLPKKAKKNAQAFTPKEVDDLADACGQYGDLVKFLASTGLRVSEALALQVRDLDFSNMKINVVRTWTTNESGVKVIGSTKTRENRTIPISPIVDSILRIRSSGKDLEQFVFTGYGGGTLDYGYFRRAYFSPAVQKLGLDGATIHWLRHTCASLMIKIGAPPTTISHILGHSGVKMTLDTYAHYYEDDTASWLEKLSTTYREGK